MKFAGSDILDSRFPICEILAYKGNCSASCGILGIGAFVVDQTSLDHCGARGAWASLRHVWLIFIRVALLTHMSDRACIFSNVPIILHMEKTVKYMLALYTSIGSARTENMTKVYYVRQRIVASSRIL
jgi:hypothetical protein